MRMKFRLTLWGVSRLCKIDLGSFFRSFMSCCCCGGVIGPRNADVIKPLSSPTLFVLSLLQSGTAVGRESGVRRRSISKWVSQSEAVIKEEYMKIQWISRNRIRSVCASSASELDTVQCCVVQISAMQCITVLCSMVQCDVMHSYCTELYCTVLNFTTPNWTVLHSTVPYCTA